MIKVYPADSRYTADHGWLKSKFSFSFAEYFDRNNMNFGPMRVLNDDIIAPLKGFPSHPHKEMEIVSIVLKGYLQHEDSTGEKATTTFGGVQRMSAGTGVVHSEVNPSPDEEVNLLQMWFMPEIPGVNPSYEQTNFDETKLKNQLLPVVSQNAKDENVATINQDLTIYLSDLEKGKELTFQQGENRKIFLFVIEGELVVNNEVTLNRRDSARIEDVSSLNLNSTTNTRFMLIDLP
ncbi:pirin family protein [Anaerobacillus arseniciselenatis]|uniref:Pirin family protein n=1 Tax=Anaerobacillus arseniciselenatis TaxID=85682 RepID=A0A1S2LKU9_9BACI|nr:pirin family protein [Anaerobacillus arseniciselenatis]OIJ12830.1 pirin family protein [Anaerobacillus arseniciselenatis]